MFSNMRFLSKEKSSTVSQESIDNLIRKCEITSSNYGNFAKRLQKRKNVFQILLPYYSVIGILNALFIKYFNSFNENQIACISFWGICISISFLVISMQITLANYPERIDKATKKLNELKILKGKLEAIKSLKINNEDFKEICDRYNEIISSGTLINERYFYATCKEADKKTKEKIRNSVLESLKGTKNDKEKIHEKMKNYIFEIKTHPDYKKLETPKHFSKSKIISINITNAIEALFYFIVYILPIIVYIIVIWFVK